MFLMSVAFGAQGNGKAKGRAGGNDPYTAKPLPEGAQHPLTNPNSNGITSTDRDKGTDRAEDVGKGKKKGLKKTHHGRTKTAVNR